MNRNINDSVRFLILDTKGLYTSIYDEIYVPKAEVNNIRKMYTGYMVVEVPNG